jgi:NAD(P)-dependent dehydrogenase (short-subunit alcohol dehydrogenase family)
VNKSVVVTGANSGIGRATALELAGAGYDVIGTARTAGKATQLEDAARERELSLRTVLLDVADAESTTAGFEAIAEMTDGGPWAVINNAGFAQSGAIEDVDDEQARYQLEVNLIAPMRIARLVLPGMRARGDGRIVNISSIGGRVSSPMTGWYCASKFGLEAATDALRVEVEPFGVRVILIEPGGFGTGIWAEGQSRLPGEADDSAYADAYARAHAATSRAGAFFPDPVWVARVIRVALANPVPLARYLVGVDAVGMFVGQKLAPTVVADYVKAVSAGLRRVPVLGRLKR